MYYIFQFSTEDPVESGQKNQEIPLEEVKALQDQKLLVFQNETKNVLTESPKPSQAKTAAAKEKIIVERALDTVSKIEICYRLYKIFFFDHSNITHNRKRFR